MKPIELTKQQRSNLLEMVRRFFPQYSEYTFWHGDFIRMYHVINGEESAEDNVSIHWYEFCLNILSKYVLKPKVTVAYLKPNWEITTLTQEEIQKCIDADVEGVYNSSEYYERVGSEFSWFTAPDFNINWWQDTSDNPTLLFYKDQYFEYCSDAYHKATLSELKTLTKEDITDHYDRTELNRELRFFFIEVVVNDIHPVDYLYEKFKELK